MIKKKIFKMAQILAEECEECGLKCKIVIEGEDNYTLNMKNGDKPKKKKKNKNEDSLGGVIINH